MTAMPCGQKNNRREMIQSQMVTPPLAAMLGTTLRLKTATTKRRTRSRRPRARMRWVAGWAVVDTRLCGWCWPRNSRFLTGLPRFGMTKFLLGYQYPGGAWGGQECPPHTKDVLVRGQDWLADSFLLCFRQ